MSDSPPRRPLHERSESHSNSNTLAAIRLVPATPPRLLGRDDVFSRTLLPTHPSHILSPGKGKGRDDAVRVSADDSILSNTLTTHELPQSPNFGESATESPTWKPRPVPKKRLRIHKDKTFSLVPQELFLAAEESPRSPTLSTKSSYSLLSSNVDNAGLRSNSLTSCTSDVPATPEKSKQEISGHINTSPWNYQFVGGLRKVPKTPDLKQKAASTLDSPLASSSQSEPYSPDGPTTASHYLSAKPSFQSQSTETATTASENTNYKVYSGNSAPNSDTALALPSSSDSNYQILGYASSTPSIIHQPQTASSEFENYEILGDPSPSASYDNLVLPSKYSQESLVVPPLKPRARRSNDNLGYYKSRSRESLRESFRTGSLTSISTVLSQQEAARAIVGSGSLIQVPIVAAKLKGKSSWANPLASHPPWSPMNETPHQWSSQLSTVQSVSEGGTDRGSRTWSDDNGRLSSAFQSSSSRHSRQVLSRSSSLLAEEAASQSRSDSLEPPQPAFMRNGQRHLSGSSFQIIEDQDEYGDGITDMQNLRHLPSRNRLSGFYSVSSADNGRTNTMRSTGSSRTNSLRSNTIPTWARLYYGSGERRYLGGLGAPGSSTEGSDSRANSFRSGSPNTDHFPLSIYSPRRRPRGFNAHGRRSERGSMEITPAPRVGDNGGSQDPYSRFRTWSMSSIWSPHLRVDRRATRHSVWEPPSMTWSTEGSWFGRRNIQILMFTVGWIFPFSWMIAAFLPLPRSPMRQMREQKTSASNLSEGPNDYTRQFGPMDEIRYESAKWWRTLNRWMCLVGILIITTIVILVVIALREKW